MLKFILKTILEIIGIVYLIQVVSNMFGPKIATVFAVGFVYYYSTLKDREEIQKLKEKRQDEEDRKNYED